MRISELLKAEQTRFISLIDVLGILSDHDGGSEISESARFLYLKLSTATSETRPRWETIPCPLRGRRIVVPRTKQWDEVRYLLESIACEDDKISMSDEELSKFHIYGFDRGEITAFIASCGVNIEVIKAVASEQKRVESDIGLANLPDELHATKIAEKPLGTRERNTLLAIIAALCNEAKIDYTKPSKAADYIQSTADKMGLSIGESTIEGHLKKIPDMLASRMK